MPATATATDAVPAPTPAAAPLAWTPSRRADRRLSAAERAHYDEHGYVIVPGVFDPAELAAIDGEISRLRADKAVASQDKYFLFQLGLQSPVTRAVCCDERVLTLIEDLVRPGIAIYSAKMVEKPPFDDGVCHWHQDDAYYTQHSASACRMSTWMPLQDTGEANGAMWVVPGSHKLGLQAATTRKEGLCTLSFRDGRDDVEGAIPVPMRAGDLLLFHALLWHRSLGNTTARTRRSYIVSYQEATAVAGNGRQHTILRPA